MSIKIMTQVWECSKADGSDLLVLLCLADMANDEGECWPSMATIARKCRIDVRNARKRIRGLEKLGDVVVIVGGGTSSSKGGLRSNRYRITVHMEADTESAAIGVDSSVSPPTDRGRNALQIGVDSSYPIGVDSSAESKTGNVTEPLAPAVADAGEIASLTQALVGVCDMDAERLTASASGALGKAVKEIAAVGGSTNDVNTVAAGFRSKYPNATLTPLAIAKHWAAFVSAGSSSKTSAPSLSKAEKIGIGYARTMSCADEARTQIEDDLTEPHLIDEAMAAWHRTRGSQPVTAEVPLEVAVLDLERRRNTRVGLR